MLAQWSSCIRLLHIAHGCATIGNGKLFEKGENTVLSKKSKAIGFILLSAFGFAMMSTFVRLAGDLLQIGAAASAVALG